MLAYKIGKWQFTLAILKEARTESAWFGAALAGRRADRYPSPHEGERKGAP